MNSKARLFRLEPILVGDLMQQYQQLSADGFRVLAVAHKHLDTQPLITKEDECDLILKGYVAFLDPPKDSTAKAIEALQNHGVTVKVLTGDNDLVTRKVCREVGLNADDILLGSKVETMTDDELAEAVETHPHLCARSRPRTSSGSSGRSNTSSTSSDSWATASTTRPRCMWPTWASPSIPRSISRRRLRQSFSWRKTSWCWTTGVIEGRKVFVNILKYVRMGASSNFGNMFSVLGASAFLPFVPMAPIQVLTNNLLYDFSQVPIPTDTVGPEQTAKPRPWHIGDITKFVLFIGPDQLDFRLHHLLRDALCFRLLGSRARLAISNRLVCRIAHYPDADHSRHPHQQDALHPRPCELATHGDHRHRHGHRSVASLFAAGRGARFHATAAALLADPFRYGPLLRSAHPSREDVADPQSVDLSHVSRDRIPYEPPSPDPSS